MKAIYGSGDDTKAAASLENPSLVWLVTHKSHTHTPESPTKPLGRFMGRVLLLTSYTAYITSGRGLMNPVIFRKLLSLMCFIYIGVL